MPVHQQDFTKVARLSEVVEGKPKAVRVKGHSIALFNVDGRIYATDNQCPHMGYPLTRGAIRSGVLTCDWHGWSFDLEGGGCFVGGCDDLATFPVDVRDDEIWLNVNKVESSRRENRLRLLQEGLLTEDSWTLSKAIALLLADGLPEKDVIELFVKHMGRNIATRRGPEGGRHVAHLISGIKVARRYESDDRLIPLMMAANGAAGPAGDRPPVDPLPPPVSWEKIENWVRAFSRERFADGIEKCLVTARHLGRDDDRILPLLYECAVEPHFFGSIDNLLFLANLAELVEELGWDQSSELACNLSAKLLGRGRPAPERFHLEAMKMYEPIEAAMTDDRHLVATPASDATYAEDAFVLALGSGSLPSIFQGLTDVLAAGVDTDRIITTLVLVAADRMARTAVNANPGWGALTGELNLAASLRAARRFAGPLIARKALFHAGYRHFDDRWLNIPTRPLPAGAGDNRNNPLDVKDEAAGIAVIQDSIESVRIDEVGNQVRQYLSAGFSGDRLLHATGNTILKDDTGNFILSTLRTIFEEWEHPLVAAHPARNQLLIGLVRYATDVRRRKGSKSAALTAQRFARGQTAVDMYE
jgi:nitrite reductase/ring-hydroxylating ferredoxin subunit